MIHLSDLDITALGVTILLTAAWCQATSTTYRAQRAENRTHRQQRNADRRYARAHRCQR